MSSNAATAELVVTDVLGKSLCISASDGEVLRDRLIAMLDSGAKVALSFAGVSMIISYFLNVAVGQLYGKFTDDKIANQLTITGLDDSDQSLLERVVENAKNYYANKAQHDIAWQEVMGTDDEAE